MTLLIPPRPNEIPVQIWRDAWQELLSDCPPPWGLYDQIHYPNGASEQFNVLVMHGETGGQKWVTEGQAKVLAKSGWKEERRI